MAQKRWLVCLDLDDTLIPNSYRYNSAIWECGLIISRALEHRGPYAADLMKLHYETDKAMVAEFGFSARRFPISWVRLYETLCERAKVAPDPRVRSRLYRTAARFSRGPFEPYPGTVAALTALRDGDCILHMITAGDERLQKKKIRQSGLRPFFHGVHITSMDKKDVLRLLLESHGGSSVMVGDSLRSDVKPARELGMRTVWIPSNTWGFANESDIEPDHTIAGIHELPDLLRSFDS